MAEINNNSIIFLDNGYLAYNNWNKMSLGDKFKRRLNIAKFQLNNGSLAKAGYALVGGYDPENPNLNTGAPEILPGKVNTSLYKSIRNIKPLYKNINKFLEKKLDFESPTIKKETIIRNTNIENAKLSQSERYKDRKTYTKKERYLDKNNRAYETSKATPVNSGLNKIKNSLLKNIITNIDKYPLYELKNLDKLKLKLAKKGLSRKEIEKHKEVKDFYRELAEHYGYFERGGKMNILEFLKNGSGIHIKEKNKGKFTSYCGGKVTDECILKGKNSSNPAIRKRATFADNARHFKHKEGGIIKAEDGTKFNWQSALTNMGTNLFSSYLQSRIQNNKINSEAEAAKAENEVDLNQYFWDIYLQELAKALLEEELKNKAISAMNDTVINSSPLVTLKIAYDKASKSYGNLKANLDARNKAIDEQAKAAKSSVITDVVSGVIQNGLGMLKDYYGSKNNNTSTTNTSTNTSNSYFDNYVNTKYKKFGTFNPDGSMNMLGGTFTIKDGYKPNKPQLFNYQPLKLNI